MRWILSISLAFGLFGSPLAGDIPEADQHAAFDPPVPIVDGLDHSQLFPAFADVDGDTKLDLLVGGTAVKGGGRLLVYPNQGTNARPVYAKSHWFDETVATARIPDGCSRAEFAPRFGDINGDGHLDLVSGANCCTPGTVHLFLGKPDGSFAPRRGVGFELPGIDGPIPVYVRGTTRPQLLDWDSDGDTDLVIGHAGSGRFLVSSGPLPDTEKVPVEPFELPLLPNQHPMHFEFADWDGDSRFDLLASIQYRKKTSDPLRYGMFWFRNTAAKGEPKFAQPVRLFVIPEQWDLDGFAVIDWSRDGKLDIVTGVSKDLERRKGGGWIKDSRLWLYQRKAEPDAADDRQ